MDSFPVIVWFGGGLLGWFGAEMIFSDALLARYADYASLPVSSYAVPVANLAGFVLVVSTAYRMRRRASQKQHQQADAAA